MKTSTWLLLGAAGAGAYYLYKQKAATAAAATTGAATSGVASPPFAVPNASFDHIVAPTGDQSDDSDVDVDVDIIDVGWGPSWNSLMPVGGRRGGHGHHGHGGGGGHRGRR